MKEKLGEILYYAIRVEFQARESPYVHGFLWVKNAPTLSGENIEEYTEWLDNIISAIIRGSVFQCNANSP